jgi:hypothetical protein
VEINDPDVPCNTEFCSFDVNSLLFPILAWIPMFGQGMERESKNTWYQMEKKKEKI